MPGRPALLPRRVPRGKVAVLAPARCSGVPHYMAIKPSRAKVIDLDTAFDAAPVETIEGPVIWATVTIEYVLAGLHPTVNIRVPVVWDGSEDLDRRRALALRCARQLIEHACRAAGVGPPELETDTVADTIETVRSAIEGFARK